MLLALLAAAQATTSASLRVVLGNHSEAIVRVVDDRSKGHQFRVDCASRCNGTLHYAEPIGDTPLRLVNLDRDGLIYSAWGTGCCYMVRVWKVTPAGVTKVLEAGSRRAPSLIRNAGLTIVTYMRPTDSNGRETSVSPQPVRWTYRKGVFERS